MLNAGHIYSLFRFANRYTRNRAMELINGESLSDLSHVFLPSILTMRSLSADKPDEHCAFAGELTRL